MSDSNYRSYIKDVMDPISKTYCAAKWYNATIWLNHGKTVSCHHPAAHSIPVNELESNPSAIHNTSAKKAAREQMLQGIRPSECSYCWDVEDLPSSPISDRVFKTSLYSNQDLDESRETANSNVNLRTIELSFDSTCNFACAYCSPTFSTTWQNLVKKHGKFENVMDPSIFQYQSADGLWESDKYKKTENPYIKAFWAWWPELKDTLQEIRITGGEPLMSDDVWKIIDIFQELPASSQMKLAINSNLGAKDSIIDRFVEAAVKIGKKLTLYTSCEGTGTSTEFVRSGMNWEIWKENSEKILSRNCLKTFAIMTTVNALTYETFPDFLEHMLMWKDKYPNQNVYVSVNILKNPKFFSIAVLPREIRSSVESRIRSIAEDARWADIEKTGLLRLLEYSENTNFDDSLKSDLKMFCLQFAERTGNPITMLSEKTLHWLQSIPLKKIIPINQI